MFRFGTGNQGTGVHKKVTTVKLAATGQIRDRLTRKTPLHKRLEFLFRLRGNFLFGMGHKRHLVYAEHMTNQEGGNHRRCLRTGESGRRAYFPLASGHNGSNLTQDAGQDKTGLPPRFFLRSSGRFRRAHGVNTPRIL